MTTFLPYPDFAQSAQCLDRQRLGKQRLEAYQLLRACLEDTGWKHHPAAKAWKGYESALYLYGVAICLEWRSRGYADTMLDKFNELAMRHEFSHGGLFLLRHLAICYKPEAFLAMCELPPWFGDEKYHASQRAALLRKDYIHYSLFGWTESPSMPYYWPEKQVDA